MAHGSFIQSARSRGFTLIELMIIAATLLIVAALVIPSAGGTESSQLREAARLVAADLSFAQVDSITHASDPRVVVFNLAQQQYHIAASSDPDTPLTNPSDNLPYVLRFGEGRAGWLGDVDIASANPDADSRITYGAYGQLQQTDPAVIVLSTNDRAVRITLDPALGEPAVGEIYALSP